MRQIKRWLCTICIFIMMTTIPTYAKTIEVGQYNSVNTVSDILPANVGESIDVLRKTPRGVFFSAADLRIENEGGEIGVVGHAYMSEPVDELYMTIYLDRQISDDKWEQVDEFEFEFYGEDYPDGLTSELVAFTLTGYPTGHYYRLRGAYAAVKGTIMEGFGPVTDGVLIQ